MAFLNGGEPVAEPEAIQASVRLHVPLALASLRRKGFILAEARAGG